VGVAYGSDVNEALALLQKVAQENRLVLEEPEPIVTFEAFGDNALMLYVRCYIASADDRLAAMTALHKVINEEFAEAGIAIAFPQRDIHLDTAKPLEITIRRSPPAAASKRRL
jgi:potassium efflux system protein